MAAKYIFAVLVIIVFLAFVLYNMPQTVTQCGSSNPVIRPRLNVKEPFLNMPLNGKGVNDSYLLLDNVLAAKTSKVGASPTASRCYDDDFQKRLERTGNYRQMTNNYKRGVPDSCSGLTHELVNTFYEVEQLPAA
jgi:hypothetical protein